MHRDPEESPPAADDAVPADDAVIGRAFRRSLAVLAAVAAVVGAVVLLRGASEEAPPEQRIEAAAPEAVARPTSAPAVRFTDVTAEAGVYFVHFNGAAGDKLLPESMGGGVAFLDFDADGDQDLLLVNSSSWPHDPPLEPAPTMALYRNDGAKEAGLTFTDVTAEAGLDVSFYGMGAAVADVDADGDTDVFFTAVGRNRLFLNDGGASPEAGAVTFTEVTDRAGVGGAADAWSTGAAFFDYDRDGDLDLLVGNYVRWSKEIDFEQDFRLTGVGRAYGPPQNYQGTFLELYANDGGGRSPGTGANVTFTDVSEAAGIRIANPATGQPMAKTLGLAPIDADGDGWIDVLVANDTVRNFYFANRGGAGGSVSFEESAELVGVAYDRAGNATGAMGVDFGHYRNDADLGFLIGNFANEMTSVYVSQGDPTIFADEAIVEGIGAPSRRMLSFGVLLFDYDLDGRLDVLQANGHLEGEIATVDPSQSYRQPAQLFWNAGAEEGFVAVEDATTGDLAKPIVGRGAAYADLDGDGDLDVVLTQTGGPPLVLRNDQREGHHWLRLELRGRSPNREAIGARVELDAGGVTQYRQVMPTRSYLSQVERAVTFGLGDLDQVDAVRVVWPDGSEQTIEDLEVDRLTVIEQGSRP